MPVADISLLLVFGFLLLAAYIGGGVVAWILSWEARRDRAELRQERQTLIAENRRLSEEILKLKEEIIDLRGQLAVAVQEINKFTAVLDTPGVQCGREDFNS
jgi:cell division protein FtsB